MFKKTNKARYIRVIFKARTWKKMPIKLLKWKKKMTSTEQEYDLVDNDEFDTRIPLHPDEAFAYGITFEAKYIGTMEVPRPTSRVEIVAAMRRVRYEFKARGVKKRKVTVDVSIEGVRVTSRSKAVGKRTKKTFFGRKSTTIVESGEVMHHPIYRIFYVSHDSSDLKIFSYIARDGDTNGFKCNVFKSNKKSQAMRIVRTVGQAFEVCHKMQINSPSEPAAAPSTSSAADEPVPSCSSDLPPSKDCASDCGTSEVVVKVEEQPAAVKDDPVRPRQLDLLPPPPRNEGKRTQRSVPPCINVPELPENVTKAEVSAPADTPLSAQHELQLLREQLEQQTQQTHAAVAQLLLLRDQLAAEQAARCEAQDRTHQLLVHNKELLEHIASLVAHLQDRERGSKRPIDAHQLTLLPQTQEKLACNGNRDDLIHLVSPNNNTRLLANGVDGGTRSQPSSPKSMPDDQIQEFLIASFQEMGGFPNRNTNPAKPFDANKEYFQNCQAFPNIPPLVSNYSKADLEKLLSVGSSNAQAMSVAHSDNSIFNPDLLDMEDSSSSSDSSDSDEEEIPFIKPLSHNGTLTATGEDGRVRLIVPVSPSESAADVAAEPAAAAASTNTLQVPAAVASTAPITRTTSEKVPNRSETMATIRSQWARHTTK